ncbi:hypothetical protein D3C78_1315500 [compost metagenome]
MIPAITEDEGGGGVGKPHARRRYRHQQRQMPETRGRRRHESTCNGEHEQRLDPHAGIHPLAIKTAGDDRGHHRRHAVETERRRRMAEHLNDVKTDKRHDGGIGAAGDENQQRDQIGLTVKSARRSAFL